MSTATMTQMIGREKAAEILGVSPGTLANWQSTGFRKIPCIKIGRAVRYRLPDLERWIEAQVINPLPPSGTVML